MSMWTGMRAAAAAVWMAVIVAMPAVAPAEQVQAEEAKPQVQQMRQIAETVRPSLVRVEYELQYDKGEAPVGHGWSQRCASCGRYHATDSSEIVAEERPVEAPGFVISPTQVVTADPVIHPRFLKSIHVIDGDRRIGANISAHALSQNAVVLSLSEPLEHAKPLVFDAEATGPFMAVDYAQADGEWQISVKPAEPLLTLADRRTFLAMPSFALVTDAMGNAVALSMADQIPAEGQWKGSPAQWPLIPAEQLSQALDQLDQRCDAAVLRATLNFRSPPANQLTASMRFGSNDDEDSSTVRHVLAVQYDPKHVLVLAELKPSVTARLESIILHLDGGKTAEAIFDRSLRDYGAFVARLDEPLDRPLAVNTEDIRDHRNQLLLAADLKLQGDNRIAYYGTRRIASFEVGWRRQVFPDVPGDSTSLFLFDRQLSLVALPIKRREKPTGEEVRWRSNEPVLTPVAYVAAALADPGAADGNNVPLSEAEERRLAWLGVELQPLTPDLARLNKVSDRTNDGTTGALVTYVYPDSPAARAGIEPGHVLLRLYVPGQPQPINIRTEAHIFAETPFPWDHLDQAPEQYFDQIPQPWPSAESTLTRTLTDLGIGNSVELEYARDGKVERKSFAVEQSPTHYASADRYSHEASGLTVRDMTYEVRRYFQRRPEEPGVIISRIEIGSKASKAGLKPFEYITHVNDHPVTSAAEFEQQVSAGGDLRLQVRRMTKGRLVKLTVPVAATQPVAREE